MAIYELDGVKPVLEKGVWVAQSAEVIGNVHLKENSNVWFSCVLRGDNELIRLGKTLMFRMELLFIQIWVRR